VIVLDASVLIAFLDGDDKHHAAAEQLLTQAIDEDLAVNSLTLAEVLVPVRDGRLDRVLAALQALDVQELPFPADTALQLAKLRAATGLKMPDCCVILAAEAAVAAVASFDERLAQTAGMRNLPVFRVA
jgi:predicted nucleic acid-binding protein